MNSSQTDQTSEPFDEEREDAVIGRAFRISLAVIVACLAMVAGAAWWFNRPAEKIVTQETKLTLPEVRKTQQIVIPEIPFSDITEESGLDFVHENGAYGDKLMPETMGGGCAFFDYDSDGDPDILMVNSNRWPWDKRPTEKPATLKLFQNDGTGKFEDVTEKVGLDVSLYGMGTAIGDFNRDGKPDIFISAVGTNRMFQNTGEEFIDVTEASGVAGDSNAWSTSCGFFDYDKDGDLDLFVCNYVVWSKEFDLAQNFQLTGGGRAYGRPQDFTGQFAYLYRNEGNGVFADVSESAGIHVINPASNVPMAKSLGLAINDFDQDGWPDILVSNDTVQNFLFHNQQDGTFVEIGAISGVAFDSSGNARGAMGVDTSWFRNDRGIGVAVGNLANEMTALYVSPRADLQFTDEAVPTGLGPSTRLELTFGVFFFDADLDGRLDLFAANGHLEEDINKVQASQHYEQSPQLFWNAGPEFETEFVPVPVEKCGSDFVKPMVGRGASYADIDGDGDLDILIVGSGQRPRLLRNNQQTGNHWVRCKLVGTACNINAIGARVEVHLPNQVLKQQVMPTRSYLSQVELPLTFGLGDSNKIEKLVIHWPDGTEETRDNVVVDQTLVIQQVSSKN